MRVVLSFSQAGSVDGSGIRTARRGSVHAVLGRAGVGRVGSMTGS